MAATLIAPGVVLSHRSAAALWGLRRHAGAIEVTSPTRLRRPGITIHQATLPADEITVHEGIPVTTAARTLFDLAAVIPQDALEWAIHEADFHKLWDRPSLHDLVARYPGHRGNAKIRALRGRASPGRTRSDLERLLVAFLDARRLDRPALNAVIATREGPITVDALWRDEGLAIEMDAYGTHNTRRAFHEDRRRDRALRPLGIYVMRLTDRDLIEQGDVVERDIRRELQRGRSPVRAMRA